MPDRGSTAPGRLCRAGAGAVRARRDRAGATITPNYKDADLRQIIEAVSAITGRNFIVDPRVRAQVTMLSAEPMSPDAFYAAFLSILEVHGYIAVPSGDLIKILPDANARQVPGIDMPIGQAGSADEIVTQVVTIRNVGAAQLVPILRPLIPQYGHLAAHQASNMLIISDRAANVNRLLRIIQRIDTGADADIEVIPLQHASSSDVVRVVSALQQAAGRRRGRQAARAGRRRSHQQRADQRRPGCPLAHAGPDLAPRHAARGRRQHPGHLPALCRCRGPGDAAARAGHLRRRGGYGRPGRRPGRGDGARRERRHLGRPRHQRAGHHRARPK
jgi:type II secretory pathway component GspD/PulD (secretin)